MKEKVTDNPVPNYRFDFKIMDYSRDPETGHLHTLSTLDPDRYELINTKDKKGYWDKFDQCFIPMEVCENIFKQMLNTPILAPGPKIDNIAEYFFERYNLLDTYFSEDTKIELSASEEILYQANKNNVYFNFMSIDLVESTNISRKVNNKTNARIKMLFLKETENIIRKFGGHIFKFEGDGLIAFYTSYNISSKIDNSLDCAGIIKLFIVNVINKFLEKKELPLLYFRIGINFGEAYVENVGNNNEIYGYDLDATCKIRELADENQILVGFSSVTLAHTYWRKILKRKKIQKRKLKRSNLNENTQIYELRI
ncbi:MAG: adenylate/guanylate cyclase domain-containing protein [Methanosphaera stadtmanae]|nr:adenylate/guanylate cyclase domain-containing protein [Methanosphaera stadtmanae]